MFGSFGMSELIIILAIALIVIGPKKLPDLAKALGKGMAEFKKATREIKESLDLDEDFQDVKKDLVDSVSELNEPLEFEEPKEEPKKEEDEETQDSDIDKVPTSEEESEQETEPSEETTPEPSEETEKNG